MTASKNSGFGIFKNMDCWAGRCVYPDLFSEYTAVVCRRCFGSRTAYHRYSHSRGAVCYGEIYAGCSIISPTAVRQHGKPGINNPVRS